MDSEKSSRRQFLKTGAAAAGSFTILGCSKTAPTRGNGVTLGEGEHRYEVIHDWARLPSQYQWQTTHNVALDSHNRLYVIHEGRAELTDHPSIFVFDCDGKFIKAFGIRFQGGGHGLEVRREGSEEFLYVTAYQQLKTFAKLTLDGETVWRRFAPMDSGLYAAGEDTKPEKVWGRDRFMPTNFAFLPDGGFFLADGYGAWAIHRYDKDANWLSCFGGPGTENGRFNTPHGLWIDDRPGREPSLVVADRANKRLQWFTFEGKHLKTLDGFILPANLDRIGDDLLVPDLSARVSLLDKDDNIIHLGEDPDWRRAVTGKKLRNEPGSWVSGKFVHPHDACYDADGNIFVAEWVATGRVSKLRRVS
ncbi:MAG: hypothetical protein KDM91_02565 [Verrucomicrobiae bacterium]|nr:hypothetical protein [Verrucomicrobiae bacterium]MCP5542149.1 hypothetical protein [Akkermansiaceae bacterium]MCP5550122.1 hypothetical protein [Akkermansiaceae bacterium]